MFLPYLALHASCLVWSDIAIEIEQLFVIKANVVPRPRCLPTLKWVPFVSGEGDSASLAVIMLYSSGNFSL